MKEQGKKKSKLWLWVGIAAAVLICAGVALALLLPGTSTKPQNAPVSGEPKIYWNVDGADFVAKSETGLSSREPEADGLFHMRFAVDGQIVEYTAADRQLVNFLDSKPAACLTLDADGQILDAVDVKEHFPVMHQAFYVRKADAETVTINSAITMLGMEFSFNVTENTHIMNVDTSSATLGPVEAPGAMDMVTAFVDDANNLIDLFITQQAVDADVYFRITRYYSGDTGETTRKPDENGAYTIEFASNGQQVNLKCKDKTLVTTIDQNLVGTFAFLFDEEGYIIKSIPVNQAIRGMVGCERVNVTSLDENSFTAKMMIKANNQGQEYTIPMGEDCKIFLMETDCGAVEFVGQQVDSLKLGDLLTCYTDMDGKAQLIFINRRLADSPMYYNITKKSLLNGVTIREKDANGYYVFDMACQGKVVQVKTKDAALASQIDGTWVQAMGLRLEGSIIKEIYSGNCVSGFTSTAYDYYVDSVVGGVLGLKNLSTGELVTKVLAGGCEVYDLFGGYGREIGAPTTLQVGDKVRCYRNMSEELTHVYVVGRYAEGSKMYFNTTFTWDYTKNETKRVPGEDGYYRMKMVSEGKEVELKTKNRKLVNYIDSFGDKMIALKVSGTTVKDAWPAVAAVKYGKRVMYYTYVESQKGKEVTYYNYVLATGVKTVSATKYNLADNCRIYNASTNVLQYRGEKTKLQKGDRMVAYMNEETKLVELIYVIQRKEVSELYWHVARQYVPAATGVTSRVPDADGYYVFDLAVNGEIKQFKTKDAAIATKVDQQTEAFGMVLKGDIITHVVTAANVQGIGSRTVSYRDVMELSGSKAKAIRLRTAAADYGQVSEIEFAKDCKFFDVSTYAENFGAAVTLQLGDRISCWPNDQGKIAYCYIVKRNTHKAGYKSLCPHCNEEVFWDPFDGTLYAGDSHYYLPADLVGAKQMSIGQETQPNQDVVFDLNGFSYTTGGRFAMVYGGTLSVVDTAGGGKLYKSVESGNIGGLIAVSDVATLNIYGGELTWSEGHTIAGRQGGVLSLGKGTINMYGGLVHGGKVLYTEGSTSHPYGGNVYIGGGTFNLYGGVIEGGISENVGGNVYVGNGGMLHVLGGTIRGGTAAKGGDDVYLLGNTAGNSRLIAQGGTIEGQIAMNGYGDIGVAGTAVLGQVSLSAGQKLTLGQLEETASIKVLANGIFTYEAENIADYADRFQPAEEGASITVVGNALSYQAPAVSYTEDLQFMAGTQKARCPVCQELVNWIPVTQETNGTTSLGKTTGHYYLAEDVTYSGTTTFLEGTGVATDKVCFHLNGHNLTATAIGFMTGGRNTQNIMGTGKISGYRKGGSVWNDSLGTAVHFLYNGATEGRINLYSGTFAWVEGSGANTSVISAHNAGGEINVYADAVVEGNVFSYGVQLNLLGATVKGNVLVGAYDNKVENGTGKALIDSATITGNAELKVGSLTLTGSPKLGKLVVAAEQKVTLGQLAEGASIPVSANGVFTEPHDKAKDYLAYITPAGEGMAIAVQGGALCCQVDFAAALQFAEGTSNAYCPACGKVVTWKAVTQAAYGTTALTNNTQSVHYYLTEDITYTGSAAFITVPYSGVVTCVHLNGHNITATATQVITGGRGTVNVMGTGIVSGHKTGTGTWNTSVGATVHLMNCAGTVNLYSGTFTRSAASTSPVISAHTGGTGAVNIYQDAVIDGGAGTASAITCYGLPVNLYGKVLGDVKVCAYDNKPETHGAGVMRILGAVTGKVEFTAGSLTLVGEPQLGELIVAEGLEVTREN